MEGILGYNLVYNLLPSSSNDVTRGSGQVSHKVIIQEVTPGDGSQLGFPSGLSPCIQNVPNDRYSRNYG